jgi:hypothetical protein
MISSMFPPRCTVKAVLRSSCRKSEGSKVKTVSLMSVLLYTAANNKQNAKSNASISTPSQRNAVSPVKIVSNTITERSALTINIIT